jgi:thymidylate synthase
MEQYHNLARLVLAEGQWEENRTGIRTLAIQGESLKFDLREGFPAITTKKLAFKSVVGELIGFLRGVTSAADFRALGCNVWDQNANENAMWLANPYRKGTDDLGPIYGSQWRNWIGCQTIEGTHGEYLSPYTIDQIDDALQILRHDPFGPKGRQNIVTAWNPAVLDEIALPACHVLFQLIARRDGTLHMVMYQRSVDLFLGLPFNIASYALLLHLFAAWSGRTAATLTMHLGDVHIYENHMEQVYEQLTREPYPLPKLDISYALPNNAVDAPLDCLLENLTVDGVVLEDYQHHPAIKAPMAV